jgi:hypothetical protein
MGGQRHEAGSPNGSVDSAGLGLADNQPEIVSERLFRSTLISSKKKSPSP